MYIGFREVQDLNLLNKNICKIRTLTYKIYNKLADENDEIQLLARAARRIIFLDHLLRFIGQKNFLLKETHKRLTMSRNIYIDNIIEKSSATKEIRKLINGNIGKLA